MLLVAKAEDLIREPVKRLNEAMHMLKSTHIRHWHQMLHSRQHPNAMRHVAGGMSANIATFESFIKESEESQGSIVTPLRQGYLHKRSTNMRREWKRRYLVLDSLGVLYYYSNKV